VPEPRKRVATVLRLHGICGTNPDAQHSSYLIGPGRAGPRGTQRWRSI